MTTRIGTMFGGKPAAPAEEQFAYDPEKPIRPRRRYVEWIGVPLVTLFLFMFVRNLFVNPNWNWPIVAEYLFNPLVLQGVWHTILLTVLTGITGSILGLGLDRRGDAAVAVVVAARDRGDVHRFHAGDPGPGAAAVHLFHQRAVSRSGVLQPIHWGDDL